MKYILSFLLFLSSAIIASANEIDSLKTDNEVLKFMLKVDSDLTYKGKPLATIVPTDTLLKLIKCNDVTHQQGVKTWQRVDFNEDGKTDLLVMLKMSDRFYVFTAIDRGDHTFKTTRLSTELFGDNCQMAWPVKIAGKQMLLFYSKTNIFEGKGSDGQWKSRTELKMDTLIYLYGGFTEYNPRTENYTIKSIHIKSYPTAWPAPELTMNILANGKATLDTKNFSFKNGYFTGTISTDKLAELKSLLNYIQIKKLKDSYRVQWTDDQTVYYEIVFEDGTVKTINDYGTIGTFGLRSLYSFLFDLRLSEYWIPMKLPASIPQLKLPGN